MPWSGCCVDGKRFLGKGVTAYHRWWVGERSEAWKQKACPTHAPTLWNALFKLATEINDDVVLPDACKNCGGSLEIRQANVSYHTFFQGKDRRDLMAVTCDDCLELLSACCQQGATPLDDRGAGAGGSGGASASTESILMGLGRPVL